MEKQKIYIVKYAKGSYEDYEEITIFATMDEIKAKDYISKYNMILDKLKTYNQICRNTNSLIYSLNKKELHQCFYEEVELR